MCLLGIQVQVARRHVMVGSSGGAVLLGNAIADCYAQCKCGLKVVVGCSWCRRVIGECRLLDAL